MARYHDLTAKLAARVADGDLAARRGAAVGPRARPRRGDDRDARSARAYRELADAGVIVVEPRRAARVSPGGVLAARALLRAGRAVPARRQRRPGAERC